MDIKIEGKNNFEKIYNYLNFVKHYIGVTSNMEVIILAGLITKMNEYYMEVAKEVALFPKERHRREFERKLGEKMSKRYMLKTHVWCDIIQDDELSYLNIPYNTFNTYLTGLRAIRMCNGDKKARILIGNIINSSSPVAKYFKPVLPLVKDSSLNISFDGQ